MFSICFVQSIETGALQGGGVHELPGRVTQGSLGRFPVGAQGFIFAFRETKPVFIVTVSPLGGRLNFLLRRLASGETVKIKKGFSVDFRETKRQNLIQNRPAS